MEKLIHELKMIFHKNTNFSKIASTKQILNMRNREELQFFEFEHSH